MRAVVIQQERDIRVEDVAEPQLLHPTDAIVKIVASCVCGSDLWRYRGVEPTTSPRRIGHEMVGIVEQVGADVTGAAVGDFVIAPFYLCDGTCPNCRNGWTGHCQNVGWWGAGNDENNSGDACQAQKARVPHADGTLVVVPGGMPDADLIPHLLTLADVMCTGHHAAVSGGVGPGSSVAVVGDGAVGLCAVLASKRLGASRIVAMSRHEPRQNLAREFGATDVVAERGDEAIAALKAMFDGIGPDAVLECVGTKESMDSALRAARPGGQVGFVGVPAGGPELPVRQLFGTNVGVRGGMAPARDYIPELLVDVLDGTLRPGLVFDLELSLEDAAEAYAAMDERRAIKVLLRP